MTTRIFLFGTLRSAEKLAVVLGRSDFEMAEAALDGFQVYWDAEQRFPVLDEIQGATATGVVITATSDDLARLDWYEGAFGYDRVPVTLADGPAEVYRIAGLSRSETPWDFEAWFDRAGAMVVEAARDAMRLYPDTPPKAMGQVHSMLMARAASKLRAGAAGVISGVRQGAGRKGVTLHKQTARHKGFFAVDELDLTHRRFDGGTERINREVFLSTDATLVLPFDPARGEIVLVEQFRSGPYRRGEPNPWSLEPIAGLIDPGETPEDCAYREAEEEAGLKLTSLCPMPGGYPSPGATAEYYHLFIGLTDLASYRPRTAGLAAEGEDILTHVLSLDAALGLLESGESNVLPLAYMLVWLAANRDRIASH